jgi:DNA invertase Pin-like site-specific DNA recombinase
MQKQKVVTYLRVSTVRQGASGLGLAAQQEAVQQYAASVSASIVATFKEIESGKHNARPELAKALHLAKVTGATLVIAKLDRLSRNAAFLMNLAESGVKFVAADMPQANSLTVGIMALVAQQEAQAISKRTKEALQAAKARGTVLGNPRGAEALRRAGKGNAAAVDAIKANADSHALDLQTVIAALEEEGIRSLGGIAKAFNERGMRTRRGGTWHKTSVSNLLARFA